MLSLSSIKIKDQLICGVSCVSEHNFSATIVIIRADVIFAMKTRHTASVGSIVQGLIPKNVNGLLVKYCPLKCLESHKNSEDSYKTLDKNNWPKHPFPLLFVHCYLAHPKYIYQNLYLNWICRLIKKVHQLIQAFDSGKTSSFSRKLTLIFSNASMFSWIVLLISGYICSIWGWDKKLLLVVFVFASGKISFHKTFHFHC